MSRPDFHANDRFITVLSGTWWMGSGLRFDPDSTMAVPAGGFVTHFGRGIHYDGAKGEPAVLLIVGEGPGTSTPARGEVSPAPSMAASAVRPASAMAAMSPAGWRRCSAPSRPR